MGQKSYLRCGVREVYARGGHGGEKEKHDHRSCGGNGGELWNDLGTRISTGGSGSCEGGWGSDAPPGTGGGALCRHDSGKKGGDGKIVYEWQEYEIADPDGIIEAAGEQIADFYKKADPCTFPTVAPPTCPPGHTLDTFTNSCAPDSPPCPPNHELVNGTCECVPPPDELSCTT